MQHAPPPIPVIKSAGELIYPDVDYPWPVKSLALLALALVFCGPGLVFLGTRRRKTVQGLAAYAACAVIGVALMMAISWGWPNSDGFVHRFGVLWRHLASQVLEMALGLALAAALLGWLFRPRELGKSE